jgi:isopenicillin N synthase-like dioxygenase
MTPSPDQPAPGSSYAATPLPIIDMASLLDRADAPARLKAATAISAACRDSGFFYVIGHGVPPALLERLEAASRRFFALPDDAKAEIAMARGGRAWRGWFPLGGELTSGRPDIKEGLYLGAELPVEHPRVKAGWALHGPNLWPAHVPELRDAVLSYIAAATRAAHALMEGVALSLGLDDDYFARHYTAEPTVLFRIFRYPAAAADAADWGVGEHTDYGLLTLLAQDTNAGLQVKTPGRGWVDAPPLPGALVCNIGDMLDRLTGGWFRSTPHRVRNSGAGDRLSFPLFFDPDMAAEMRPLPQHAAAIGDDAVREDRARRWDGASVHTFEGTYGDYLMSKIAKVFPDLGRRVL